MKCVKCDMCGIIVDESWQGNKPPQYLYNTVFISRGGDLDIKQVNYRIKHLCNDCTDAFYSQLKPEYDNEK